MILNSSLSSLFNPLLLLSSLFSQNSAKVSSSLMISSGSRINLFRLFSKIILNSCPLESNLSSAMDLHSYFQRFPSILFQTTFRSLSVPTSHSSESSSDNCSGDLTRRAGSLDLGNLSETGGVGILCGSVWDVEIINNNYKW